MARPTTKIDLIEKSNEQYNKMMDLVNSIPYDLQNGTFNFDTSKDKEQHWKRDKNIKDVLIHLYEWHQLFINWVESNTKGISKQFLIEGYNWRTYGEMNIMFYKKHEKTSYEDSLKLITKSHNDVMDIINKLSNEELFSKDAFLFTLGQPLGSYAVSVTCSHYDWAIKKIKRYKKQLNIK